MLRKLKFKCSNDRTALFDVILCYILEDCVNVDKVRNFISTSQTNCAHQQTPSVTSPCSDLTFTWLFFTRIIHFIYIYMFITVFHHFLMFVSCSYRSRSCFLLFISCIHDQLHREILISLCVWLNGAQDVQSTSKPCSWFRKCISSPKKEWHANQLCGI